MSTMKDIKQAEQKNKIEKKDSKKIKVTPQIKKIILNLKK